MPDKAVRGTCYVVNQRLSEHHSDSQSDVFMIALMMLTGVRVGGFGKFVGVIGV